MNFDWDEAKNLINLRKHGVEFVEAAQVFSDPNQLPILDRVVDGEVRWKTIGRAGGVLLLTVAHTVLDDDGDEYYRIISARRASPREREHYEENL